MRAGTRAGGQAGAREEAGNGGRGLESNTSLSWCIDGFVGLNEGQVCRRCDEDLCCFVHGGLWPFNLNINRCHQLHSYTRNLKHNHTVGQSVEASLSSDLYSLATSRIIEPSLSVGLSAV